MNICACCLQTVEHCYYHGSVKKDEWSSVAVSTCNGIRYVQVSSIPGCFFFVTRVTAVRIRPISTPLRCGHCPGKIVNQKSYSQIHTHIKEQFSLIIIIISHIYTHEILAGATQFKHCCESPLAGIRCLWKFWVTFHDA